MDVLAESGMTLLVLATGVDEFTPIAPFDVWWLSMEYRRSRPRHCALNDDAATHQWPY
jgi:hypothetical protein